MQLTPERPVAGAVYWIAARRDHRILPTAFI
jgi:hypothetical protein